MTFSDTDVDRARLGFTPAAEITPSAPEWIWERWLARGELHLLVGRQGHGKSTWAAYLMANIFQGRPLPGTPTGRLPLRCALLSFEEGADRLVARLYAAGADVDQVLVVHDVTDLDAEGRQFHRPWRLPNDCHLLEDLLVEEEVAVVVIDGLGYVVNGDSHNYGVVGSALSALAGVAQRTGCAVVGVTHPPKGSSDSTTVAIGSTAWTAVTRVVWLLGVDPDDETGNRKVVRVAKSNYREPDGGWSFTIGSDEIWEIGYVGNVTASTVTAEALAAASMPAEERSERDEARGVVRQLLADGSLETSELVKLTRAAGLSDRTVERARRDLGVRATQVHDGRRITGWRLSLPEPSPPASPPLPKPGGVGGVGGVALNREDSDTTRIKTAKDAKDAGVTHPGGIGL